MRTRPTTVRCAGGLCLAAAAFLVLANALPAQPPAGVRGAALQRSVDAAIERGVTWLLRQREEDGTYGEPGDEAAGRRGGARGRAMDHTFGRTALAALTLAHCGYRSQDAELAKTLEYLQREYRSLMKGNYLPQASTYSLSILVLALQEIYAGSQAGAKEQREGKREALPRKVRSTMGDIVKWILAERSKKGLFRYPGRTGGGGGRDAPEGIGGDEDMSCTQYALLAIWVASRHGITIESSALQQMARRLLEWQESEGPEVKRAYDPEPEAAGDGYARPGTRRPRYGRMDRARGFGYAPGMSPTGSMTAAGMSSLLAVKAALEEEAKLSGKLRRELEQATWDSIAWLAENYSIRRNPQAGPSWHYYYLYGLERACVIAGKRFIGDHEWYPEGARFLVRVQQRDGCWDSDEGGPSGGPGGGGPRGAGARDGMQMSFLDTCFAILFLKRAAPEPSVPLLPQQGTTRSAKDQDR